MMMGMPLRTLILGMTQQVRMFKSCPVPTLSDTLSGSATTAGLWECVVEASDGTDVTPTTADIEVDADWDGALTFTNCGQTGRTGPHRVSM